MPGKRTARERRSGPSWEQEQAEPAAQRPRLEPVQAGAAEPGRPYQAFVENEVRKFWQEISKDKNLVKPTRAEIRAAAMPILCRALRRRTGNDFLIRAHHAVADVVEHAREQRWTTRSLSEPYASSDHVEALVQLAYDAGWLAREIPLPAHPDPQHPVVYYTEEPHTKRPIPREDSYIRADYVRWYDGSRLTDAEHIYPMICDYLPNPDVMLARGTDCCFTMVRMLGDTRIVIHWLRRHNGDTVTRYSMELRFLPFSLCPRSETESDQD